MEFDIGNIVTINGRDAVLEYDYGRKYGDGQKSSEWSVRYLDRGNSHSWVSENIMVLKEKGSLDVIKQAEETYAKTRKRNRDLNHIKEIMLSNSDISSESILKLFEEIEYNSSFLRNGEFSILFLHWEALCPIFIALFNNNKEEMLNQIENIIRGDYKEKFINNCTRLFDKVNK